MYGLNSSVSRRVESRGKVTAALWADGHGEYLHTGHEGARACQKIFCHHSRYSGVTVTVSQAVCHIRWDTGLILSSGVNKSMRASLVVDMWICEIISPNCVKVAQMGSRKVPPPSCATSLWNQCQNLHEAWFLHQLYWIRHCHWALLYWHGVICFS